MQGSKGLGVVEELARRGLFRERDLTQRDVSRCWLETAHAFRQVTRHGHGVWGHPSYKPTRYELLQVRVPNAVFWGPSALWLFGIEEAEPEALWIAIANKPRVPRNLDITTAIIRTRRLEDGVISLLPEKRLIPLRVYRRERAEADLEGKDCRRLLIRAADRARFEVPLKRASSRQTCRAPSPSPAR